MSANSIQQLNPRHYKILEFVLRGWTNKQIADHFDIAQGTVSVVTRSKSFQHEVSLRRAKLEALSNQRIVESDQDITDSIREGAKAAVDRIIGCVQSVDENIAVRAATEVLDRAGFPKVSKIEHQSLSVTLTGNDLVKLQKALDLDKD